MMPMEKPQAARRDVLDHLRHITRRWGEVDVPCLLEVRLLTNDDKATVKDVTRYTPDRISDAADHICAMNHHSLNAYAVINPINANAIIATGSAAKDADIVASFFHWADADDAQAASNIKSFVGPLPTYYVLTGTKPCARPHVYWEIEEPTLNLDAWNTTQKAIAATLKTDASVVNPSRIMRVAGTVNWPKPKKLAKGYVEEVTTLHIHSEDDRPLVSSERMTRAFVNGGASSPPASAFKIETTPYDQKSADHYEDILRRCRTDGEKHTGVRDLAAHLAGSGVARVMAEAIVRDACPVWDEGVEMLLDTAYAKFTPNEVKPVEATPQAITSFRIDSSADFLSDLQPLEYLIDGLLPRGVTYSLTGHAGHGKTTLALQFAISVARGDSFEMRETSKGSVLILAGENPYNVKWQYAAALAARDLSPQDVNVNFVQGRFSIKEWTEVLRSKMEAMPDLKLVIVDSLQAFFEGDNDNDNSQMVDMAHALRGLCDTSNRPALLIIAHPAGKTPSRDNLVPRGGGAFLNEIDGNLTVWSQDASQQTLHHSQKFRGAGFDPIEWVMQIHEFNHLTDIHGTPLKLPVSRPETHTERTTRQVKSDDFLRQYLSTVEQEQPLSVREGAEQFRISRYRMETLIKTAKEEKLIKRYAKTYVITEGGRAFLEANNAGV